MANSGILMGDSVARVFKRFNDDEIAGFILRVSDDKKSVEYKEGEHVDEAPVMQWLKDNADDCKVCWFVIRFEFKTGEKDSGETENDDVAIISWVPDTANIKHKMVASTTMDAVKKGLSKLAKSSFNWVPHCAEKGEITQAHLCDGVTKLKNCTQFDVKNVNRKKKKCS